MAWSCKQDVERVQGHSLVSHPTCSQFLFVWQIKLQVAVLFIWKVLIKLQTSLLSEITYWGLLHF